MLLLVVLLLLLVLLLVLLLLLIILLLVLLCLVLLHYCRLSVDVAGSLAMLLTVQYTLVYSTILPLHSDRKWSKVLTVHYKRYIDTLTIGW